jgi:Transposase DDE domain group 1
VDQGGQAGRKDDPPLLPSFPLEPVRLALSLLAYNLGNLCRRLALPKRIENWSLTSLQQRLVKTGGRLVKHARYYWLLLAEGHLTRRRFGAMLDRIALLPFVPLLATVRA